MKKVLHRSCKTIGTRFYLFYHHNMPSLYQKYLATIKKWVWKAVDFDWKYANQCVDFVKKYAKELDYPITTYGNAKDFARIGLGQYWTRVYPPAVWDIVIFPNGKYWHIAVVNSFEWAKLYVHEQNRDGKAYANNNEKSLWSLVALGMYTLKGNEVFFRVK